MKLASTTGGNRLLGSGYCCITDPDFRLVKANRLFTDMFTTTSVKIVGKQLYEVIHVVEKEKCDEARINCLANPDQKITIDLTNTVSGGTEKYFRWEIPYPYIYRIELETEQRAQVEVLAEQRIEPRAKAAAAAAGESSSGSGTSLSPFLDPSTPFD